MRRNAAAGGQSLRFFVSHVRVRVRAQLPEVMDGMSAVWGACSRPLVPVTANAELAVAGAGGGYAVTGPDGRRSPCERREDALPLLESALYAALPQWHAGLVQLHAACLCRGQTSVLLLGRSGAGKSSLALAALRRGYAYFGDELALTDGTRLWGVPRAIQFSPVGAQDAPPPWARDADLSHYRMRLPGDRPGAVPLVCPRPEQIPAQAVTAAGTHVYAIARGTPARLQACSPLQALALLHEAAFSAPGLSLGALVGAGRCGRLTWDEPERGLDLLDAELARA